MKPTAALSDTQWGIHHRALRARAAYIRLKIGRNAFGDAKIEVLAAVLLNIQVFWNDRLCCLRSSYRRFGVSQCFKKLVNIYSTLYVYINIYLLHCCTVLHVVSISSLLFQLMHFTTL